ncbi:hypothetical protein P4S72_21365 [Vibrio sp. PP-XX7]
MARNKNLRQSVANQLIEAINIGHLASPLPSQSELGELFSVGENDNTVCHP